MILGIGSDITQIPRIERLVDKFGDKFISRILSADEKEIYSKKSDNAFIARRFAGKEAIFKALGVGAGRPIGFKDISIMNDDLGAPKVKIMNHSTDVMIHVSLSDDYPVAIAFAVATLKK